MSLRLITKSSLYATAEFRISIHKKVYTLGYTVKSREGYLLCYNEVQGYDLSLLVRRCVQEMWGNYKMTRYWGPFYDGISQLLKGHKIPVCIERKNKLPKWCKTRKAKKPTKARQVSSFYFNIRPLFKNVLPFLIFCYGVLWLPFIALVNLDGTDLFKKMVISLVLIVISMKFSDFIEYIAKTKELSDRLN
jgi:hypothetical protein